MGKHATKHGEHAHEANGNGNLHDAVDDAGHPAEPRGSRVRRAMRRAGDARDRVAATSARAVEAIDASEVGPDITRGASRAAGTALRNPVPTAIAAAYVAGFLKGRRRHRRSR